MLITKYFTRAISLASIIFLLGCIEQPNSFPKLPPGEWRGILKLSDPDQIMPKGLMSEEQKVLDFFELPFNMKVEYEGEEMNVYLVNGKEEIEIETVHYGRDPSTAKDTVQMKMDAFDTSLDAFYEDNFIEGYWVVNYKENYKIPFIAIYGQNHRFINRNVAETKDFSGKWKVNFEYDNDNSYPAIAEFKQDGNMLSGTFLTETGDYRFLEGNAYSDKMRLSVFDGAHAFLFSGSLQQDTIYGEFRSGKHYKSKWMATRDANYTLTDPYEMTKKTGASVIDFSFPDPNGDIVSLSDKEFNGKVKLISILGTWCPNCKDEVAFLKEVKRKNKEDIEVITIAFERYRNADKATAMISKYKSTLGFDWPILLGGYADKKETTSKFPFLDKVYSYPTLLMVDRDNKIQHIHTGFNGPATSRFEAFEKDFDTRLRSLISE